MMCEDGESDSVMCDSCVTTTFTVPVHLHGTYILCALFTPH